MRLGRERKRKTDMLDYLMDRLIDSFLYSLLFLEKKYQVEISGETMSHPAYDPTRKVYI